jgi:DNA-binding GntR family transcriptional regulator
MPRDATTQKAGALTKQELVYRSTRECILDGTYSPGYRIVIHALAQQFKVSAIPVREAIRRLEAEGLVVFQPNKGACVAPADPGAFDQGLSVVAVLEGYATALAAPAMDTKAVVHLTEINRQMVDAMNDLDALRFGALNRDFHAYIYEFCANAELVELLDDIGRRMDAIRRTVFVRIPYRGAASVAEHLELIALIKDHAAPATIESAARNHKLNTLESFRAWQREHPAVADAVPELP